MALNATMYRFNIDVTDLNRSVFESFAVSAALHPSETLERMAIRVLAYCLHYSERLEFTKGLSTDNEPDVWEKSLTGDPVLWIELGLPDTKRIKKASSLSEQVYLYVYGGQSMEHWLAQTQSDCERLGNVTVRAIDAEAVQQFSESIERGMSLSCMIEDDNINLSWQDQMLELKVSQWVEGR